MQLKLFQKHVLDAVSRLSKRLRSSQDAAQQFALFCRERGMSEPALTFGKNAWEESRKAGELPLGSSDWIELLDGLGREVPNFCLKVPTGGGKTLIGAHAIGRILQNLYERTTGVVVWVMPSEAILTQTIRAFQNPRHPYREALELSGSNRVRVLTKNDRFSRDDVEKGLVVILVMLQSTVREESDYLRVFRDSGGFSTFFPKVDDVLANKKLMTEIQNLECVSAELLGIQGSSVRHSLANVLRICRPIIVIDEGHRAYTDLARKSLLGLSPSAILELTATPNMQVLRSNVLVSVGGVSLKNECLIKLPINVTALVGDNWKAAVRRSLEVRASLEKQAKSDERSTGRYIRPIVLVRVEATGIRKQSDSRIHVDDVKKFLETTLKIPGEWIRLKTATTNEIGDEDLLSRGCEVRVILTKDALREGWDCPFAYVLAVLNARSGPTAITQMVGRVLRQPYANLARASALNEAHVVCITADVKNAVDAVSKGLEEEGLSDVTGMVKINQVDAGEVVKVSRSKACSGDFLLPVVAIRAGDGWEKFNPERHLLKKVDWNSIDCPDLTAFSPRFFVQESRVAIALKEISGKPAISVESVSSDVPMSMFDDYVPAVSLLQTLIPGAWVSFDLLRTAEELLVVRGVERASLPACRMQLAKFLVQSLSGVVDKLLEETFREAIAKGDIRLYASETERIGCSLPALMLVPLKISDRPVYQANGKPLRRNAFSDVYESNLNGLETAVVRDLDGRSEVTWWWRVPVRAEWGLIGWRLFQIFPDIVALANVNNRNRLLILESKGAHLVGNADTIYKKGIIELLQKSYGSAAKGAVGKNKSDKVRTKSAKVADDCRGAILEEVTWQTDLVGTLK